MTAGPTLTVRIGRMGRLTSREWLGRVLGLDHLAEVEGVAAADQARAAFDAGEYVGGIERGLAVLRVGSDERVLIAIPLEELQATLDLLYPPSGPS